MFFAELSVFFSRGNFSGWLPVFDLVGPVLDLFGPPGLFFTCFDLFW